MSSVITTGEDIQDYTTLYIKLKNLSSIIKKTASSSLYNKGNDNSDKINIKKFFESGFDKIFPTFDSFGETTPIASYDDGKHYVINDQSVAYHTVENKIFKNLLYISVAVLLALSLILIILNLFNIHNLQIL